MLVLNKPSIDRKACCPKCTALVKEPSEGVYKCRICSTLLMATGKVWPEGSCFDNGFDGVSNVPLEFGVIDGLEQPSCKDKNFSHQISSMDHEAHAFHRERIGSAFHGETRRYPSYKTPPSSSSSRSGEGSDKSDRGKHMSSIFLGSCSGSEGGNHSLPWSLSGAVSNVDATTIPAVVDHDRATPVGNQRQACSFVELSFGSDGSGIAGHWYINTGAREEANFVESNGKGNVGSKAMSQSKNRTQRESRIRGDVPCGASYHVNADHVDEDMMKLVIADCSNGFAKGPTFSHLSKGDMELERVEREHPLLASSPRSLRDSRYAIQGVYAERLCPHSIGAPLPTAMQVQGMPEQDASHQFDQLDAEQGIFLPHGYTHQERSKPLAQPYSNGAPLWFPCCKREEYAVNPYAYKNNGDPYRATFNGSMEASYSEGTSGYLLPNITGRKNCLPFARTQGSWDAQSHSDDLYLHGIPQQPKRNSCTVVPLVPPEFTTLHDPGGGVDSHHAGPLYAPIPACTCSNHNACATGQPILTQNSKHHHYAFSISQPSQAAHQEGRFRARAQSVHDISLDERSRRGEHDALLHGEIGPVTQHACLAATKEKGLPPLPWHGAAPYVLCQGCSKVLQVPKNVPYESAVQRLRCSACKKVSKFTIAAFVHKQIPMAHGYAGNSSCKGNYRPTVNAHDLPLTARTMHPAEQHLLYGPFHKTSAASNSEREGAMDIDLALEVPNPSSDNHNMVVQQSLPAGGVKDVRDVGAMRPPTSTTAISQGQQVHLSPNQVLDGPEWKEDSDASAAGLHNPEARVSLGSQSEVQCQDGGHAVAAPVLEGGGLLERCDSRPRVSSEEMKDVAPREAYEKVSIVPGVPPMVANYQNDKQDGVEASDNCVSSAPGSPLYEHLSYDAASSDTGEWTVEKESNGGRAGIEVVQEASKGTKSLTGLLKKSIREFGKGGQGSNKTGFVAVNGQIIRQAAIESAEKQAGKIHPGTYWYDYHAGFWGVMGGPCLGIIPSMIEELKIPLTRDCAGGNTEILINGRELHKKDLEVLVGRGMPRTPGKAYMLDISGHIVDQESGKVLKSLGRLAPTIQRRGRGCGMYQLALKT